jgi:hypothetical protein
MILFLVAIFTLIPKICIFRLFGGHFQPLVIISGKKKIHKFLPFFDLAFKFDTLNTALQRRLNLLKYIAGVKWGGHPKVLNILYKNFIRSKMNYGATAYGNAPKTRQQKLDTLQNACLRVIGGVSRPTLVHVLTAANTIPTPEQRRTWMTGKEVVKSVSLNTPLGMTIRKLLETHDTTSTAKSNLMEKQL